MRSRETPEHQMVARWLDAHPCILWLHVPGGGYRGDRAQAMRTGRYLKSLGAKAGAPDILIFSAPPSYADRVGCAIEMKSAKGTLQKSQKAFLANLAVHGWHTMVCRSGVEAIDQLILAGYDMPLTGRTTPHSGSSSSAGGGP